MADFDDDIFSDLSGLAALQAGQGDRPADAPAADPITPATPAEPTQVTPIYEEDYESPEAVQDILRNELGEEKFTEMYTGASRFVGELAKYDPEGFEFIVTRIGNHPVAVKLAYTIACMLDGCRPAKAPAAPSTTEIDNRLKEFSRGGSKYDAWMSGDTKLNEERIALYSRKYPGKMPIDNF